MGLTCKLTTHQPGQWQTQMERRVVGIFLLQSGRQNLTQFAILSHLQLHACPDATWYMLSTTHTGGATECCHLVHAVNNSHWRCNRVLLPGTCCQQLTLEVQKRNASSTRQQNSHWRCKTGMYVVNNSRRRCKRGMHVVNNSHWRRNRCSQRFTSGARSSQVNGGAQV